MHYSKNKFASKMHFSVDNLSKICYNIITLPMGEGPGLKKDEKKIRFWLTFAEIDRIIYEYTGARDGAHQKKS